MTADTAAQQALAEIIGAHVKADATGLAPAVISHVMYGFDEAAQAILDAGWMPPADDETPPVKIDYINWRGERSIRLVRPVRVIFGSNEWHPEPQYLLEAVDLDKGDKRTFALMGIHSFLGSTPPASTPSPDWRQIAEENAQKVADYKEVLSHSATLVREIDIALNGVDGAAKQASLCDLVDQIGEVAKKAKLAEDLAGALEEITSDYDWRAKGTAEIALRRYREARDA